MGVKNIYAIVGEWVWIAAVNPFPPLKIIRYREYLRDGTTHPKTRDDRVSQLFSGQEMKRWLEFPQLATSGLEDSKVYSATSFQNWLCARQSLKYLATCTILPFLTFYATVHSESTVPNKTRTRRNVISTWQATESLMKEDRLMLLPHWSQAIC